MNTNMNTDMNTNMNTNMNTDMNTDMNTNMSTDMNTNMNTDINTNLNMLLPEIINDNIYNFTLIIDNLRRQDIIFTYADYAQYILYYVIKNKALNILDYLIINNTFDFYNNNEYLNYNFNELLNLNSSNFKQYNFYTYNFTDIEHPLFYLLEYKNYQLFDYLLNKNINVNIINTEGITLLDYLYFKKEIPQNIKTLFITKLLYKGATWQYVKSWKEICKYKYIQDITNIDNEFMKYNTKENRKAPYQLIKALDFSYEKLMLIYSDIYLLKNAKLFN